MKIHRPILFALFWGSSFVANAQTMGEWFNQKKTQTQYLLKQIAELKIYLGYVKRGYRIVEGGLNTIHDIKNGEFKLHDLYYKSLELVNPHIRNSPKAREVIRHQVFIIKSCDEMRRLLESDSELPDHLKTYISETIDRLMAGVENLRKDLESYLTDHALKMTDEERLRRLDSLYQYSKSIFVFTQKFASEVIALIKAIQQERGDDEFGKRIYGMN